MQPVPQQKGTTEGEPRLVDVIFLAQMARLLIDIDIRKHTLCIHQVSTPEEVVENRGPRHTLRCAAVIPTRGFMQTISCEGVREVRAGMGVRSRSSRTARCGSRIENVGRYCILVQVSCDRKIQDFVKKLSLTLIISTYLSILIFFFSHLRVSATAITAI